ncbi:MAG: oligosaccharide flippase family protein [Blastocatellia bacterium]
MKSQEQKTDSLTTGAAWILFAKVMAFALNIALPLLLVRRLSQGNFGLYKQAFLVVSTSIALLPLGFGMTAFYFLPREKERKPAVIFNILLFNCLIGGAALLVILFFPQLLANLLISDQVASQAPQMREQIVSLSPLISVVVFTWLFSSFLELIAVANQETRRATFFIILAQFTKAVLLLAAAIFLGTVRSLLFAALLQGILQTGILFHYLHGRFPGFWRSFDWEMLKRQVSYAMPYAISVLIWTLQTDMHNYFVSHHFGQAGFAIYAVGVFQLPLAGMLAESVASVMIPRVSHLQNVGDKREIIRLTASAMRGLAIIIFPFYGALVVLRREFIVALFTDAYLASVPIFLIYSTLLPFSITPLDSIARAFIEVGRFITKMRITFFFVLAGGLWLAIQRGDLRHVVGTVIGVYVIENLLTFYQSSRVLGVERRDLSLLKDIGKIAVASAIAAAAAYAARRAMLPFEMKALWLLLASGLVFGAAYLMAFLALRIATNEEWEMVLDKVMKLRGRFHIPENSY